MKYLLILLTAMLSGCATAPDITQVGVCESLGVVETGRPMGELYSAEELYQKELEQRCAGIEPDGGHSFAGCAYVVRNGQVAVYYRYDDPYAMQHEFCHLQHGTEHTVAYREGVANGHPIPYMP